MMENIGTLLLLLGLILCAIKIWQLEGKIIDLKVKAHLLEERNNSLTDKITSLMTDYHSRFGFVQKLKPPEGRCIFEGELPKPPEGPEFAKAMRNFLKQEARRDRL